jgi:hypothetical protein
MSLMRHDWRRQPIHQIVAFQRLLAAPSLRVANLVRERHDRARRAVLPL